jgi:hypothetical protein
VIGGAHLVERFATRSLMRAAQRDDLERRSWALAMLAELAAVPPGWPRARYALGARIGLARARRPGRRLARIAAVPALLALLVVVDWSPSDVANQAALATLVAAAFAGGLMYPRRWGLVGLLVGGTLSAVHIVALALDHPPPYAMHPAGYSGAASLLILLVPALLAALGGAAVGRSRATNRLRG